MTRLTPLLALLLLAPLGLAAASGDGSGTATECADLLPAPLPSPVCATAVAIAQATCTLARTQLTCTADVVLGGGGKSDLMLPGKMAWSGQAVAQMCPRLPCSNGVGTRAADSSSWAGLVVLGGNEARTEQRMTLASYIVPNPPRGSCVAWEIAAQSSASAEVAYLAPPVPQGLPTVAQAMASAGSIDTGSFCV